MDVFREGDARSERGDAARFSGDVTLRYGPEVGETGVAVVRFSSGARTHWHSHPGGQLLYVLKGRARVRSRGGPGAIVGPGDLVYVPPGEEHFHGATPDQPMVHLAVNAGGSPAWGAAVTDEDFADGFA